MNEPDNSYHISFFKPTTPQARFNRNLVIWLASIWFIAIFGFHILLRIIEKPVPEPAYTAFIGSWDAVKSGEASTNDLQMLGQSTLSVLGKIAISDEERTILSGAMSHAMLKLFHDSIQSEYLATVSGFESLRSRITNIRDEEYVGAKMELAKKLGPMLGLSELDARNRILPVEISAGNVESLSEEIKTKLPGIMEKYLIHNQSALTDFIFLGFPFHYFYTAVFLLVLFVGLCWLYCIRTDRRNRILGIED